MSNTSDVKFFTAEGIKKMEEELDYLRSVKRGEVAEKIKVARSFGDLSENAEYDEARKEQSFMEGRIQELEYILSNAQVIREEDLKSDVVNVGSVVTVYNETRKKEQVYSLFRNRSPQGQNFSGFSHRCGADRPPCGRDRSGDGALRCAQPAHRKDHPINKDSESERKALWQKTTSSRRRS